MSTGQAKEGTWLEAIGLFQHAKAGDHLGGMRLLETSANPKVVTLPRLCVREERFLICLEGGFLRERLDPDGVRCRLAQRQRRGTVFDDNGYRI